MTQRELELKLECRKRELDLQRKKRDSKIALIAAQNQTGMAQLEQDILRQESIEGKESDDQITDKVSVTSPSFKHFLAPSTHAVTDFESRGNHSRPCTDVKLECHWDMFPKNITLFI